MANKTTRSRLRYYLLEKQYGSTGLSDLYRIVKRAFIYIMYLYIPVSATATKFKGDITRNQWLFIAVPTIVIWYILLLIDLNREIQFLLKFLFSIPIFIVTVKRSRTRNVSSFASLLLLTACILDPHAISAIWFFVFLGALWKPKEYVRWKRIAGYIFHMSISTPFLLMFVYVSNELNEQYILANRIQKSCIDNNACPESISQNSYFSDFYVINVSGPRYRYEVKSDKKSFLLSVPVFFDDREFQGGVDKPLKSKKY